MMSTMGRGDGFETICLPFLPNGKLDTHIKSLSNSTFPVNRLVLAFISSRSFFQCPQKGLPWPPCLQQPHHSPLPLSLSNLIAHLSLDTTQHSCWFHVSAAWMETSWQQGLFLDFFNTKVPGIPEQCLACGRSSINTCKERKIRKDWEGEREGGKYQWINTQVNG